VAASRLEAKDVLITMRAEEELKPNETGPGFLWSPGPITSASRAAGCSVTELSLRCSDEDHIELAQRQASDLLLSYG
jgi:hypothetical protein